MESTLTVTELRQPSSVVVLDFETDNEQGQGLHIYHDKFDILSASFYFPATDKAVFLQDLPSIKEAIRILKGQGFTFVVYNASFEIGCLIRLGFEDNIHLQVVDAMWLFKCLWQKGDSASLVNAVEEVLSIPLFKDKHLQKLVDAGKAKSLKEAKSLVASLESEDLEAYNNDDVIYTYKLYKELTDYATSINYNWHIPHYLYMGSIRRNVRAYIRGIKVEVEKLQPNLQVMLDERENLTDKFFKDYFDDIGKAVLIRLQQAEDKKKKPKLLPDVSEYSIAELQEEFNLGSSTQLATLIIDVMGIYVEKKTATGKPCMAGKFLHLYGDVGCDLVRLSSLKKPITELSALIEHTAGDGRLHALVRAGGTITGRGASGLSNI